MTRPPVSTGRKWRPSLGQVTLAVLIVVVTLPLVGLFFFRVLENQLIRETESELIAQSAVLAQIFAREVEAAGDALPRGKILPDDAKPDPSRAYDPILPSLDLTSADLLPARPDGRRAPAASAQALEIGRRLRDLGRDVQKITLAGFRFLDATGRVIGGTGEVGLSFAGVPEVDVALTGRYASVIRSRVRDKPTPPLYSISRGTKIRVFVALPVVSGQRVMGVVYASRTPNNIVKYFYAERAKLLTASMVVLAVVLVLGFFFIRLVNRPVADLIGWTRSISAGDRPDEIALGRRGTREIAQLADSFAAMAESLHHRSEYIATFAAHVSHELKSPLTTIQGAAELLRDQPMSEAERGKFLATIVHDAERLTLLLNRLRDLARAENLPMGGRTTLADLAEGLRLAHPGVTLELPEGDATPIAMSSEKLSIILGHLIGNSAAHGADRVAISVIGGQEVTLDIRDNGKGVSPGNREKIFDAFFTTRRESGGTGVGLEIVKSLLQSHKGAISLIPSETGAHFRITLPLV
ncbi:MAG: HAMP domain-containing sensor histidine kinase [Pseudomonadota bacterium]